MADPLSISSALLAIITATAQSSKVLYQTVQSFRNHQRAVKQLADELEALTKVLDSLQSLAANDPTAFLSLRLPLFQCHRACTEFEALLVTCSKHSNGTRTSFRDWARLRYMDGDITQFVNMLAGYKSTIAIALADANLRSTGVTLAVLNEYKDMIQSTSQDLEDHLREINIKLQALNARPIPSANSTATSDQQRIQDEIDSTEQCLLICEDVLHHINKMRLLPLPEEPSPSLTRTALSLQELNHSHMITISTLMECSDKLQATVSQLRTRNEAQIHLQQNVSQDLNINNDVTEEAQKLEDERVSAEQCLAICAEASGNASSDRVHMIEDVTTGDKGQQIFVSTLGDLFRVKGVSAGDGAIQFVGSVSDATLRYYFQNQQQQQ